MNTQGPPVAAAKRRPMGLGRTSNEDVAAVRHISISPELYLSEPRVSRLVASVSGPPCLSESHAGFATLA